jgi:hypothetical protein
VTASGKTETLCQEVLVWGKLVYTFQGNENLLEMGARVITADAVPPNRAFGEKL